MKVKGHIRYQAGLIFMVSDKSFWTSPTTSSKAAVRHGCCDALSILTGCLCTGPEAECRSSGINVQIMANRLARITVCNLGACIARTEYYIQTPKEEDYSKEAFKEPFKEHKGTLKGAQRNPSRLCFASLLGDARSLCGHGLDAVGLVAELLLLTIAHIDA